MKRSLLVTLILLFLPLTQIAAVVPAVNSPIACSNLSDASASCSGSVNPFNPTTLQVGSDNSVSTITRNTFGCFTGNLTSLAANEHLCEFKMIKAVTIESIVLDIFGFTCASNPTLTYYDCGTTVGACTSGQTATIATMSSVAAIGATDVTISTANVAAGHYIAVLITAGTCATFNAGVLTTMRSQ